LNWVTFKTVSSIAAALCLCGHHALAQTDNRLARATEARLSGEFETAIELLQSETTQAPENADAWLQLGLSLMAVQKYGEAREALNRTLRIAPDYRDAEIALARLDWFEGKDEQALRRLSAMPSSPEADMLKQRIEEAQREPQAHRMRLNLGIGRSELSNGLPSWSEIAVGLGYQTSPASSISFAADYAERFDLSDIYLEARAAGRLNERLAGFVAIGGAPDAIFRPELSLTTGADFYPSVSRGPLADTVFSGEARYADYPAGPVQSAKAGFLKRLGDSDLSLGATGIFLSDENGESRSGYSLRADYAFDETRTLRLDYTDAPETSDGVTLDVKSYGVAWRQTLSPALTLQINVFHETRRVYDRTGVFISTGVRF
tara:strand:+ start:3148 stop:4272 length:1125 start_codon:yes stop_codon:yes gene_type:complete